MQYNYEWVDIYQELADKLLEYKDKREELIDIIYKIFSKIEGVKLAKLEDDGQGNSIKPYDIDPFTIFALFNKNNSWDNRTKIIQGFKDEFSLKSDVPTYFAGIPILNANNALFYQFGNDKGEQDIDNLWNLFKYALEYSKNEDEDLFEKFAKYFDKVIKQKGVKWNITMGLYWIRPFNFINLDSTNRTFLSDNNNIGASISSRIVKLKDLPSGSEYLTICNECKFELENNKYPYVNFPELSVTAYDDAHTNLESNDDEDEVNINYWIYSPGEGAKCWNKFCKNGIFGIGWNEIKDINEFESKTEIKEKLQEIHNNHKAYTNTVNALWQFANEIQIDDVIIVKKGKSKIIGMGIVKGDYFYDETKEYPHIRKIDWIEKGDWTYEKNNLITKTLTKITDYPNFVTELLKLINDEYDIGFNVSEYPRYTKEDFLSEAYISEEEYNTLENLLNFKKNLIIQGAPGTGKTFIAKRLAYSIMGLKDPNRVRMVQFHHSYSYEDFIMGYKPTENGFELKNGSFYNFCKKAEEDDENSYFFIIDEINRGNLSKVFGELFMLIENDKRGDKNKIRLVFSDESFFIPKNLYIIGLMNTSDRSLAMIDYALRRRFAFFTLKPGFNSQGFIQYQESLQSEKFNALINLIGELNDEIQEDSSLGEGFAIGHSYFSNIKLSDDIDSKLFYIIEYEIIPLLKEYWFDEPEKVETWSNQLRSVIK